MPLEQIQPSIEKLTDEVQTLLGDLDELLRLAIEANTSAARLERLSYNGN